MKQFQADPHTSGQTELAELVAAPGKSVSWTGLTIYKVWLLGTHALRRM